MRLFSSKGIVSFLLSIVLLLVAILFALFQVQQLKNNLQLVEHTNRLITRLESLVLNISESESVTFSYIFTNKSEFIDQYNATLTLINLDLSTIGQLTTYNHIQGNNFNNLRELTQKKIAQQNETIQLKKTNKLSPEIMVTRFSEGRTYLEKIKLIKMRIENEEEILLHRKEQTSRRNILGTIYGVLFCFILCIGIGIILLLFAFRYMKEERKLKADLLELNENKNRFFSIISHDLKGPVNNILNLSEMLGHSKNEEERLQLNSMLEASSKKVYHLLSDLLKWANSQMEKITISPQKIQLNEFMESTINTLEEVASNKNITIKNEVKAESTVWADYEMLNTVFRNLISNGIKFTKNNGYVAITSSEKDGKTEIYVKDNGIGMSQKVIDKLFRTDITYTSPGTNNEKGTGLGLQICKDFVEKNGGTISVESEVDKGTTFKIILNRSEPR